MTRHCWCHRRLGVGLFFFSDGVSCFRYTPVGRSFFTASEGCSNPLGGGREVWFGFHQSVRPSLWKMMLNIDGKQRSVFLGVGGLLRGQELGESLCGQPRTRPVWEPEMLRLTWPVSPVRQARAVVLRCSTELPGVCVSNRVPNTAAQLVCTGQNWVFSGVVSGCLTAKSPSFPVCVAAWLV